MTIAVLSLALAYVFGISLARYNLKNIKEANAKRRESRTKSNLV